MLELVRNVIREKDFSANMLEMKKLVRIAAFGVNEKSRSYYPMQPEYIDASHNLNLLAEKELPNTREYFDYTKDQVELIIEGLYKALSARGMELSDGMSEILHGQEKVNLFDEINFALHIVEQNNIDFFKTRISHLPSQPHDRIFSHVFTSASGNEVISGFLESSALPESIREEVLSAFKEINLKRNNN